MPRIVFKVTRDEDRYVEWSTIVEAPTFTGTRAEMMAHLSPGELIYGHQPEDRLRRADETGTSAAGGFSFFGAWDDSGLVVEQRGVLRRERLGEFLDLFMPGDYVDPAAYALLEPFED